MPPVTVLQIVSAAFSIAYNGWKLAQTAGQKLKAEERARLQSALDESYLRLKSLATPEEMKDAASSLAQSHSDILR